MTDSRPPSERVPSLTTTARFVVGGKAPRASGAAPAAGRVPRVSRLMALAIRFDGLVRHGAVTTQAELAAVGHVTRARVTQIMNLLYLAPDLQEAILFLPLITEGRDPLTEHELRPIAAEVEWSRQRRLWQRTYQTQHSETPASAANPR